MAESLTDADVPVQHRRRREDIAGMGRDGGFDVVLSYARSDGMAAAELNGWLLREPADRLDLGRLEPGRQSSPADGQPGSSSSGDPTAAGPALSHPCGDLPTAAWSPSWNCPTLVIWGRADPYLPVRYAERQRDM